MLLLVYTLLLYVSMMPDESNKWRLIEETELMFPASLSLVVQTNAFDDKIIVWRFRCKRRRRHWQHNNNATTKNTFHPFSFESSHHDDDDDDWWIESVLQKNVTQRIDNSKSLLPFVWLTAANVFLWMRWLFCIRVLTAAAVAIRCSDLLLNDQWPALFRLHFWTCRYYLIKIHFKPMIFFKLGQSQPLFF